MKTKTNLFKLPPIIAAFVLTVLFLTGCGSTSSLQTSQGSTVSSTRKFSKVVVQDFQVSVAEHATKAAVTKGRFPELIAGELRKTGRFSSVARTARPDSNTLVISGVVTKYDEGNAVKRGLLGMGFGMAFLEADVEFRDSKGARIGTIKVDKNSYPLGGWIGATQNPDGFMEGAAKKIAEEAVKLTK